jgi:hypothetical protein
MIQLKPGVRAAGVRPEIVLALRVAEGIWKTQGQDLVVTSLTEGNHSRTSLHYAGAAADLRIWNLDAEQARQELAEALGDDYDVVLETDHIHCEFQPKSGYSHD